MRALEVHVEKGGMKYPCICLLSHQGYLPAVYVFVKLCQPPLVLQFWVSSCFPSFLSSTLQRGEGIFMLHHTIKAGIWCVCNCVLSSSFSFTGFHNPLAGFSLLILEVSRSHTMTQHSQYDSSGRVISPSQRPDRHPCPRQDSNPQSQQASSCRPTP
jgi:hypothetical protein